MPIIIVMRHANAQVAETGMRDFDRALSTAGWAEANLAVKLLDTTGLQITKLFCSPAKRTEETLDCVLQTIPLSNSAITFEHSLYSGDVASYQHIATTLLPDDVAMFVGHNPMIEHFAFDLAKTGDEKLLKKLKFGFPTAAIAIFKLENTTNAGKLIHFFTAN